MVSIRRCFIVCFGVSLLIPVLCWGQSTELPSSGSRGNGHFSLSIAASAPGANGTPFVLVGADEGNAAQGRAYIFDLRDPANPIQLRNADNVSFPYQFGFSLAFLPDITNDGVDEILVGEKQDLGGVTAGPGRGYIFDGATATLIRPIDAFFPFARGQFGWSVAGVRDANDAANARMVSRARLCTGCSYGRRFIDLGLA